MTKPIKQNREKVTFFGMKKNEGCEINFENLTCSQKVKMHLFDINSINSIWSQSKSLILESLMENNLVNKQVRLLHFFLNKKSKQQQN